MTNVNVRNSMFAIFEHVEFENLGQLGVEDGQGFGTNLDDNRPLSCLMNDCSI